MLNKAQKWFKDFKQGLKCEACNENRPAALEFHHAVPQLKTATIATLVYKDAPIPRIQEELEKCMCLCANCHKCVHAENGTPKDIIPLDVAKKMQLELLQRMK